MEARRVEAWQPPITPWGQIWRTALMLCVSGIGWLTVVQGQWHDHRRLFWLDIALGAVAIVLVYYRRRWPMSIALATAVLGSLSGIAGGPAVLAAVSVATYRRFWQVGVLGLVNLTAAQTFNTWEPVRGNDPYWLTLTVNTGFIAATLGWGMYIGSRRELLWQLRQRAERAEAEQELRAEQSRTNERARIAREMHDVLAHRISQISMHAGALGFRTDLTAEEMRASATVIQQQAHRALTDLRDVLGVLRDAETGELRNAPQPTYADVPRLVEEARGSGLHVEYDDLLARAEGPVPDVVGRTLYRIVQEGITNVVKHAPGALLRIRVSGSPEDGVDILLRNPLGFTGTTTPGAGLGLIGLAERAALRGGHLEGRRDGSTFVLRGWIPWAA